MQGYLTAFCGVDRVKIEMTTKMREDVQSVIPGVTVVPLNEKV